MDFDKPKVYGDTSITDGLVFKVCPLVQQVGDPSVLSITSLSIIGIINFAAMLIHSQKHQLHHHIHPLLIHSQKNKPHHHIPPSY